MGKINISNKKEALNLQLIHQYLSERSYWAKGRSIEIVQQSIENSLCFGVYDNSGNQLAFARVVTDFATFGWLMDVFVFEEYRGQGLGKKLMNAIINHPDLKNVTRMGLGTDDAHGLYEQFGFTALRKHRNMMERVQK